MDEFEQSKICLNDECLLNYDVIHCQNIEIISSSLPRLTMINLHQIMRRKVKSISNIKSGFIFVSGEEFKDQETSEVIFGVFHSVTNPTLIIDCSFEYDKRETDLWSTLNRFSEKKRIIFIVGIEAAQSLQDKLQK